VTQSSNRVLIVGAASEQFTQWQQALVSKAWKVDSGCADKLSELGLAPYEVVVLVVPDQDAIYSVLKQHPEADIGTFLPIMSNTSAEAIVDLVRAGINDVLLMPFSHQEFLDSVERVALCRDLHQENRRYRHKLERKNKELKESLNILRMDQIAGRQVQKNLMPSSSLHHRGYTVSYKIIPSLYLSGDFVAYNLVFDRYILFYIADVSGHGASSAFVTILLRFILKRILRKHMRDNDVEAMSQAPQGFIEHVNRQLLATGLEKQLTMFAGVIDTHSNKLRYSVAAQVPMPVLVSDGKGRFLDGKGKVIGLFEDVHWHVNEIQLPNEFELVMVSDGLLETLAGDTLEAREKFLIHAVESSPANHEAICKALSLDAVVEAKDDVSILSICHKKTS
jgi:phosphoserine phosphatase RsbU/P